MARVRSIHSAMKKCSRLEERALRRAGLREKSLEDSDTVGTFHDEEYPIGPCAANLEYLRKRKEEVNE